MAFRHEVAILVKAGSVRPPFEFTSSPVPSLVNDVKSVCFAESVRSNPAGNRFWISLTAVLCLGLLSGLPSISRGATESSPFQNVRIGFDGTYRLGNWTAVEFDTPVAADEDISYVIRAVDPDGQGTIQPLNATRDSGGQTTHVRGLFRSGRLNGVLQLQIRRKNEIIHSLSLGRSTSARALALKQSTTVWLTLGNQPVFTRGLERWNTLVPGAVHHISLERFDPPLWSDEMLDGVDVIVVTGDVALSEESAVAIRNWVRTGGRFIIAVGDTSSQLEQSPLSSWLPITPRGQVAIGKLSGIQDLVPRSAQLRTLTTLPSALLDREQGVVLATDLSGPQVLRAAYGTGQVTVVAVRMDQGPLASWESESQARLAGVLAGIPVPWDSQRAMTAQEVTTFDPSAVTDLQAQLNNSLDHFNGMPRTAPWSVIGWIALFALIIGPVDLLIVRYWLNRPEWTWGTMAFWILLASGLAISRGNAMNDRPAVSRQINSIDVDLSTDTVSGYSWYNFYSPQNQRQRVTARRSSEFFKEDSSPLVVSWINRPGEGYRGMAGSGGLDESKPQYQFFQDRSGIVNFPVRQWASGGVFSEWDSSVPATSLVTGYLEEAGVHKMAGTIEHHLPGELEDWFIAYGNFAYFERPPPGKRVRPLPPGTPWDVGQAGSNLLRGRLINMIQSQMTGREMSALDDQQRIPYDPNTTDPLVCELVTSFYQVLGGASYCGLRNESLKRLDLSETIGLKYAVLFGRLQTSPVEFELDGKPIPVESHSTMVRIILPVKRMIRMQDAPPTEDLLQLKK